MTEKNTSVPKTKETNTEEALAQLVKEFSK